NDRRSDGLPVLNALALLLLGIRARGATEMTGAATLRGLVLPVGGIKEKVLAAPRAGIKRVILPQRVRKDLNDVPEQAKKDIEFVFVTQMDEVLRNALESDPFKLRGQGSPEGGPTPAL